MQIWFLLAIVALVFFGVGGTTQKLSTDYISFELSFLWFFAAFVAISVALVAFTSFDWHISWGTLLFAVGGGILNGLGVLTSFAAFEKGGKASVVVPLINLYPIVTIAGAAVFLHERLTTIQILGIGCALVSVYLLSQEREQQPPNGVEKTA